jgi:histidinol phosphatase-like enzyme
VISIKVLFLDIDGVLNYSGCKYKLPDSSIYFVDDEKVKLLKQIIDATACKVVLSSTWRIGWIHIDLMQSTTVSAQDFISLKNKLNEFGIEFLSRTPRLESGYRGEEIDTWLKSWRGEPVESFVILDDDTDMKPHGSRLVQTSFEKGLTQRHVNRAIKMLNETQ